jgi:hypothetical protein
MRLSASACVLLCVIPGATVESQQVPSLASLALDIRGAPGASDSLFSAPVAAILSDRGRVAVADAHGKRVYLFESSGARVTKQDTSHAFHHVVWLSRCDGGSVLVWDMMHRDVRRVSSDGIVETSSFSGLARQHPLPSAIACSRGGTLALLPKPSGRPEPGTPVFRTREPLIVTTAEGAVTQIGPLQTSEFLVLRGGIGPRPLGKKTLIALSADRIYISTGDAAHIQVWSLTGDSLTTIEVPFTAPSPSAESYERAVEDVLRDVTPRAASFLKQDMIALGPPAFLSAIAALLVDEKDKIWVAAQPAGGKTRLLRIEPDGRIGADVFLPDDIRPTSVSDGRVAGVRRAPDGRMHVSVYALPSSAFR